MIWLFLPLTALAESVAVLPVTYKIYQTNEDSAERAGIVKEAVVKGVELTGLTPMLGDDIDQESAALAPAGRPYCDSSECVLQVTQKVGADLGVLVTVSDQDGQFDIQIFTTHAAPIAKNPFGTLKAIQNRITALVSDSLKEALRNTGSTEPKPEVEPQTDDSGETPSEPKASDPAEDNEEIDLNSHINATPPAPPTPKSKKFKKPLFFSLLGVTAAIGIGYGASETVAFIKDGNDELTHDQANAWKLGNRIGVGVLAAAVITTGVIGIFTDFKGEKEATVSKKSSTNSHALSIKPVLIPDPSFAQLGIVGAF